MTPPFTLPLTPEAFTDALHKGLGRAMQHARTCGLAGLEQTVVDACLHNHAFDPQIEGRRSDWLMKMIYVANAQDHIIPELLAHLNDPCDIHWDLVQRSRIALELARRGNSRARELVYALLRKSLTQNEVTGYEEVILLDGARGLIHVAEFLGSLLEQNPDFWTHDSAVFSFDRIYGDGTARTVLDAAALHSPPVARYLKHIDERNQRDAQPPRDTSLIASPSSNIASVQIDNSSGSPRVLRLRKISAEATISEIRLPDSRVSPFWFAQWGRCVPPERLVPVFDAMLTETDTKRLHRYLSVFEKAALPTFDPAMLQYSDHADSSIRQRANLALSHYSHPDVRALALARIAQGCFTDDVVALLNNNFRPEDTSLIERHITEPPNAFEAHRTLSDLIELFKKHTVPESQNLVLFAYDHTPCSFCRCWAVEILMKTEKAPAWLIEECRDDFAESIRSLFPPVA